MQFSKTLLITLLALMTALGANAQAVITSVVDGPLAGGTPKAVELFIIEDIPDQTLLGISSANNGGGSTGSPEYIFPEGSLTAGSYIYIANDAGQFESFFGFAPDIVDDVVLINGDDAVELFFNGNIIDVFGDVNMDGTGEPWEYLDGWVARKPGTGPDGMVFVLDNWIFSGVDALDGETSNETAVNPVPIQSYGGVDPDTIITVRNFEFDPEVLIIDINTTVRWESVEGSHNVNGSKAKFPDNPEGFFNGPATQAPWIFDVTFTIPGVYEYVCDPHEGLGMGGLVVVRDPADVYIDVLNNEFVPRDITIDQGQTVSWINVSGFHNVNGSESAYPDNPSFFSSGVATTNWIFSHTFETAGLHNYHCDPHLGVDMIGTVLVEDKYNDRSIAELRENDTEGLPVLDGEFVRTIGVVYEPNFRPDGLTFVITDGQGNGINVFNDNDALGYVVNEGDMINVAGEMDHFFGLSQIRAEQIEIMSTGNMVDDAIVVPELDEETESVLVTLEGLSFVDLQSWPASGESGNVLATRDNDTFEIRIDGDLNISSPGQGVFDVTGIGSQFDPNAPYDEGYQLLPRNQDDIQMTTSLEDPAFMKTVEVFPLPFTDFLTIESESRIDSWRLYASGGQVISEGFPESSLERIGTADLVPGSYILELVVDGHRMVRRVLKQ